MKNEDEPARLFVAVWPPADVVDRLAGLRRDDSPDVRWTPAENWHVTLRFLGTALPGDAREALDGAIFPAGTAQVGPHIVRLGRDGVVAPVDGAAALAAAVTAATASVGRALDDRAFTGHITLGRLRRRGARCSLLGQPITASFDLTEVLLVRSTLSPQGARYEPIASWPTT